MTSDITLLIPTFNNRHHYLTRILVYYRDLNAGFKIIIADSGPDPFAEAGNYSFLEYLHTPGSAYTNKMYRAINKITTPYTVMCADDDFITLNGINKCMEFLNHHSDYSSAQGHLIAFTVPGELKIIPWMFQIVGLDINDNKPTERILHFFKHHIYLHYSVHRTKNLLDTFSLSKDFSDTFAGGSIEYFLDIISIINGKHKVVPVFYGAQELAEISGRNSITNLAKLRGMENYIGEYNLFIKKISDHIAKHENIQEEKAAEFIADFFLNNPFFQSKEYLPSHITNPLSGNEFKHLKKTIDKIKGVATLKNIYSKSVHYLVLKSAERKKKKKIKEQTKLTRTFPGFPFYDNEAKAEWKLIEQNILSHRNSKAST